ncbi:MAG: GNAT family N-acetyltransferase [Pseudomonadota bacterium]
MTSAVRIRDVGLPPNSADRAYLEAAMAGLQEFERPIEPNRRPGAEMAAEHVAYLLDWATGEGGVLFAEDDQGLAGALVYGVEEADGRYVLPENQRFGYISDLWVEPRARRRGVASALIGAAEERLAAAGMKRIEISAIAVNLGAIRAYEALGYRRAYVGFDKPL